MPKQEGTPFLLFAMHDTRLPMRWMINPLNHSNRYCSRSLCVIAIVLASLDDVLAVASIALHPTLPQQRIPHVEERSLPGHVAGDLQPLKIDSSLQNLANVSCLFRIKVPFTKPGDVVKIVGSAYSLGHWRTDKALALKTSALDFPWCFKIYPSWHKFFC